MMYYLYLIAIMHYGNYGGIYNVPVQLGPYATEKECQRASSFIKTETSERFCMSTPTIKDK